VVFGRRRDLGAIDRKGARGGGRIGGATTRCVGGAVRYTTPRAGSTTSVATEFCIYCTQHTATTAIVNGGLVRALAVATDFGIKTNSSALAAIIIIRSGIRARRFRSVGHGGTTGLFSRGVASVSATATIGVGLKRRAYPKHHPKSSWGGETTVLASRKRASAWTTTSHKIVVNGRADTIAAKRVGDGTAHRAIDATGAAILRVFQNILTSIFGGSADDGETDDGTASPVCTRTSIATTVAIRVGSYSEARERERTCNGGIGTTIGRCSNIDRTAIGVAVTARVLIGEI